MREFARLHPAVLFSYFLFVLVTAMFSNNPVIILTALVSGCCIYASVTKRSEKLSALRFYIPMFIIMTLTNPLFSHNGATPLFFISETPVTLEALLYGAAMAVMLIAVMMWCKGYSAVMTNDKFVYLFGNVMPKLSLLVSITLRYIPMMQRKAKEISRAQKTLGMYSADSYTDRVRAAAQVFSSLTAWSLERAIETGRAMKTRGYELAGHTHYSDHRFDRRDAGVLCVCSICFIIALTGIARGDVSFNYYPRVSTVPYGAATIVYIALALLMFMPVLIEAGEAVRWSCCRSKI